MKGFIQVFFFITAIFLFHSCDSTSREPKEPKDFIPKNTSLIIKIDDFEVLKKYGAGMIKMLVYLGTDTQDYTDWGTKLYENEDRNSFSKEIVFQPGNAFIFIPNKYSYHGTDYNNKLNGYRFMMGAEFVED